MPESNEQFSRRLLTQLLRLGRDYSLPAVKRASWQLAEALTYYVTTDERGAIYVPHYWAIFVHEGRGPFGAPSPYYPGRKATFLVWFRDPKNDPRLDNGRYPERVSQVRRLTEAEFKYWLGINRQVREQYKNSAIDPRLIPVPMIVTKYVSESVNPQRFFSNAPGGGMHGFRPLAADLVRRMFSQHVEDYMGKLMRIRHRGLTVKIL